VATKTAGHLHAYEENIGMLTPLIANELREAEGFIEGLI
jgi:hypothetical protein